MSQSKLVHLFLHALLVTALPNVAWAYISWKYKLGISPVYIWPWVLISTFVYAIRAYRFRLLDSPLGKVRYDLRSIRVSTLPFLVAFFLPFLDFAISPRLPATCLAISLVGSGICWTLFDISSIFIRPYWRQP